METIMPYGKDRVQEASSSKANEEINQKTKDNIQYYSSADEATIKARIKELDKEWDIERTLELNASILAFCGVILGATVHKRWLILPGIVMSFLAQHAIQGWCPPLPLFRKMGIRTQKEIEAERHALMEKVEQQNA